MEDEGGSLKIDMEDPHIRIVGPDFNIIGRGVIIHACNHIHGVGEE